MPFEAPFFDEYNPGWWLERLDKRLCARASNIAVFDRYYRGDHPLAFASEKFKDAFGGLFREFASNWCGVVVDAVEERLNIEGFRLGRKPDGDRDAWDLWQYNQLDADSQIAHTEALINGVSYALVWPGEKSEKYADIWVEHPNQVIVEYEPGNRRRRRAALKKWLDDDGYIHATLYLPNELYKFRSGSKRKSNDLGPLRATSWERREVPDEEWPLKNPLGVVPVVPLINRPRLLADGVSELAPVIPIQDGINKLIADMLVASEYAAIRQRWATGMEIPIDPVTKQPLEPFKTLVDRLFVAEDPDVKFGEFSAADLGNYVKAIELLVQHVASQTRTPPHYFYLSGQFPSGESIKSAETGLVAKARRKQRHFGEGWEEVIRLAFVAMGKKQKAKITDSETIWGDPESRTEGEHVDALLKKQSLGVPDEQLWEDAGYTPTQIARFKEMRAAQPVKPVVQVIPAAPAAE